MAGSRDGHLVRDACTDLPRRLVRLLACDTARVSLYCSEPLPSDQRPSWVTNVCASISPIIDEVALFFKSILPNT